MQHSVRSEYDQRVAARVQVDDLMWRRRDGKIAWSAVVYVAASPTFGAQMQPQGASSDLRIPARLVEVVHTREAPAEVLRLSAISVQIINVRAVGGAATRVARQHRVGAAGVVQAAAVGAARHRLGGTV